MPQSTVVDRARIAGTVTLYQKSDRRYHGAHYGINVSSLSLNPRYNIAILLAEMQVIETSN